MASISWKPGLDFGLGHDNLRGEAKQQSVEGEVGRPRNLGQAGDTSFVLATSVEEYDTALNINAEADVGVGFFGGSGKFDFKTRCKVSTQSTLCIITVYAKNAYQRIERPRLSGPAWDLLKLNNSSRFRQRFGDQFVAGMHIGVEFYGVVRIEARTVERQLEIASKIQASYTPLIRGQAGVSFNEQMNSTEHRIEAFTYQRGGVVQVVRSIPDLIQFAGDALTAGRNGQGYPFEAELDPYEELEHPTDNLSFIQIESTKRTLIRLFGHLDTFRRMQNDVDFVLRNPEWFESPDIAKLNSVNDHISTQINVIRDKADICSRDIAACQDCSPEYPDLQLPPRKAGVAVPAPQGITVPNLYFVPETEAINTLHGLGLSFTVANVESASVGRVVAQSPAAASQVSPGHIVALSVGRGGGRRRFGRER